MLKGWVHTYSQAIQRRLKLVLNIKVNDRDKSIIYIIGIRQQCSNFILKDKVGHIKMTLKNK